MLVDNRKPEVRGPGRRSTRSCSGRARDDASPITQLEYAIDGGDWQLLAPTDGICDDLVEAFTIKLPELPPGPHAVTVRAWDSADNVGAARRRDEAPSVSNDRQRRRDAAACPPPPEVFQIEVGLLQNFCEILFCPETREAAIVDPAWEVDRLLRRRSGSACASRVLITHTHNDHIEGVAEMVAADGRRRGREPARGGARASAGAAGGASS